MVEIIEVHKIIYPFEDDNTDTFSGLFFGFNAESQNLLIISNNFSGIDILFNISYKELIGKERIKNVQIVDFSNDIFKNVINQKITDILIGFDDVNDKRLIKGETFIGFNNPISSVACQIVFENDGKVLTYYNAGDEGKITWSLKKESDIYPYELKWTSIMNQISCC